MTGDKAYTGKLLTSEMSLQPTQTYVSELLYKAFFEKSVLDSKSCLHYLLPPRRLDPAHRLGEHIYHTSRKHLKLLDIITLSFPLLLIITSLLVH